MSFRRPVSRLSNFNDRDIRRESSKDKERSRDKPVAIESVDDLNKENKDNANTPTILFDCSKSELFNPNEGFKILLRKLRVNFKIKMNKEELSRETLEGVRILVLMGAQEEFDQSELSALKEYISLGGSILLLAAERTASFLNPFLSEYGITLQSDPVVRTVYRKEYFHPKEVFIKNTSMISAVTELAGKGSAKTQSVLVDSSVLDSGLSIIYPFGCTLQAQRPAFPFLSSRHIAFPANRPIGAIFRTAVSRGANAPLPPVGQSSSDASHTSTGSLLVLGSARILHDSYLTKEDNSALLTAIIKILTTEVVLEPPDEDCPEVSGTKIEIPDSEKLAERLRSCLQEPEELPTDFTALFDHSLFKYDTSAIPEVIKLYETLHVKHEPISLIPPSFEVPLPPLQPAVFMPYMRELPPPALELFDLDQDFASDKLRLAQLTNKCTEKDLDYYVKEAGEILGVTSQLAENKQTAKHVLEFVLKQLVAYKKMEQADVSDEKEAGPSALNS